MEDACRELDFKLALESAGTGSISDTSQLSISMVRKLSLAKLERDTLQKLAEVTSEMLTFYSLTVEDPHTDSVYRSLSEDVSTAQKNVADKVYQLII